MLYFAMLKLSPDRPSAANSARAPAHRAPGIRPIGSGLGENGPKVVQGRRLASRCRPNCSEISQGGPLVNRWPVSISTALGQREVEDWNACASRRWHGLSRVSRLRGCTIRCIVDASVLRDIAGYQSVTTVEPRSGGRRRHGRGDTGEQRPVHARGSQAQGLRGSGRACAASIACFTASAAARLGLRLEQASGGLRARVSAAPNSPSR